MSLFERLRVGQKLVLLAGVPVLGILVLSALVVLDVQERVEAAAGLGSIEDLAQLTAKMLNVIDELQWERAEVTYATGTGMRLGPAGGRGLGSAARLTVKNRLERTDAALGEVEAFLATRNQQEFPAKLKQDLESARAILRALPTIRARAMGPDFELLAYLDFFAKANDSLIAATAALTQLSEDKQLLLSIGSLVSAMQVIEREAREHAVLNYVFGKREFPPGSFRYFVTLLTEQQVYSDSLRTWASEEEFTRLSTMLRGPMAEQIAQMRQVAIDATEDTFSVDAQRWFETQSSNMQVLGRLQREMAGGVHQVVSQKVAAVERATRLAMGLVLGIVAASVVIGWAVARGLTRSVRVLSTAAETVHKNHDFTIRAAKISSDELGLLTDAFNGMLAGIQERDRELDAHRQNLEALVTARTRQLSERNEEMALVLDNIDQGLAIIDRDAKLMGAASRSFKEAFGTPTPGTPFYEVLAQDNDKKSYELEAGFEQMIADVLPIELSLDQLPKSITHQGRQYSLSFIPLRHGGELAGALLVVRDITTELLAQRAEAEQRERVRVFERIMRDRAGFQEFFQEAQRLVTLLSSDCDGRSEEALRTLHTLKGVAAMYDISSVSEAAHALEQALAHGSAGEVEVARQHLFLSWDNFRALVGPILGDGSTRRLEISRDELGELIDSVRAKTSYPALLHALIRLTYEPVSERFARMEDQIKRLARRLSKPVPLVVIRVGDVRLPAQRFRTFWSSMAHVVRNLVDHGLESEDERERQGKPLENRIELSAKVDDAAIVIEVADDGRGIDWERLALKARQKGLPAGSRHDLEQALFADGVSTAAAVSQISGRGVGMSAVRESCLALGGTLSVVSERGQGTCFRFSFPPFDDSGLETSALLGNGRPSQIDSLGPPPFEHERNSHSPRALN
jgi:two-component system chemotaxis sensor kinase CheA